MSTPQQPQPDQRAQRLHRLSLMLAIAALSAAIPLCLAITVLLAIINWPRANTASQPAFAILDLPITGWPALLLQQGPVVVIAVALFSLLLGGIARGLKQQSQAIAAAASATEIPPKESAAKASPTPLPASPHKPERGPSPLPLAVISLVLAALMLCALVPLSGTAFNDFGEIDLFSVSMVSAHEGWAVGDFYQSGLGDSRGVIWHYHNGQWVSMRSPTKSDLNGVSALPDGDAWAVGLDGTILHEHGGIWTQEASGTPDELSGIAMISPTEGWAVGGNPAVASANNRFVASISAPAVHSRFSPAGALQPRDESNCTILHYVAGRWSPVTCPATYLLEGVAGLPDGEAWAVGDDGIFHERQGVWKQVKSPGKGLRSIAVISATEGWAVGDSGTILQEQGGVWSQAPQAASPYLDGVAVSSTGEGWMVGGAGSMLHVTKGAWYADANPDVTSNDYLYAVTLLPSRQEGWAVGADQLILHLQYGVWSLYSHQASSKVPQ